MSSEKDDAFDAATVEVVRNYLTSAATEMQRTLTRTAYNTIIYEILDFGISIYDAERDLIADSPGLAMFLGANDYGIDTAVEHLGEDALDPGDVVLVNYPYWSGTHVLDVLVFMPVFHDEALIGYTASRAHWLDLGAKARDTSSTPPISIKRGLSSPGRRCTRAANRMRRYSTSSASTPGCRRW